MSEACQVYNHFDNILRLFDVLPNFPFTTIQVKRSAIIRNKRGIYEVVSRLAELLKT